MTVLSIAPRREQAWSRGWWYRCGAEQ